jgi:methyl-accepting chemotaxis protein
MRDVEQGDLDTSCPVVTNDEIGAVTEGFNRMVGGLREREFLKETFGKYVSREIRDEILAGRVSLEGQAQEVTICSRICATSRRGWKRRARARSCAI